MSSPCFCIKQGDNPFTALESSSVRGFFCFPSLNSTTNHGIPIMKRAASDYTQLANGRAPSFHGRYPASSLLCAPPTPVHAAFRLCLPLVVGFHPPDGSPRFLDQSFDTRRPQPPRLSSTVAFARSSPWIPDFGTSGILGRLASSVSRPNRVHLRYGSRLRFERLRSTNYSILRSRSYMAYEHFTWQAPFFLLD